MNTQFREQTVDKEKEIDLRIPLITMSQADREIHRIFTETEKATDQKRSRISKSDKEEAGRDIHT